MAQDTLEAARRIAGLAEAARGQLLHLAHRHLDFAQLARVQQASGDEQGFELHLASARRKLAQRMPDVGAAVAAPEGGDAPAEGEAEEAAAQEAEAEDAEPEDVEDEEPGEEAEEPEEEEEDAGDAGEPAEEEPGDDEVPDVEDDEVPTAYDDDGDAADGGADGDKGAGARPDEAIEAAEDDEVPTAYDEPDEPVPGDDDDEPVPGEEDEAGQSDEEVAEALARLEAQGGAQAGQEASTIPAAFLDADRQPPNLAKQDPDGDDEQTMIPRAFLDPEIRDKDRPAHGSAAVRVFGNKGQAVDAQGAKQRPIPMEEAPSRYTEGRSPDELGLVKEEAEYQGPQGPSITPEDQVPGPTVDTSLEENPEALPRADISDNQFDQLTAAAEEAITKGNLSVAADRWTDLLDLLPDHVAAYIGRGRCYLELGDYAAAMSDFQKAEDLDSEDVEPVVAMGDLYFARKEYQRAIECFDHALSRDASHAMARCRRGISHYQRKNYRQAFLDLQKAYNLDPNIPNIRKYVQMAIKKLEREGKRR